MRNTNKIITLILIMGSINAYEFSFYNNTNDPIAIAIQFANGDREPLYKQYIKPGYLKSFVPGTIDIPDIKWSFCLRDVYYAKNPTFEQRAHYFAKTVWRKARINWTDQVLEHDPKKQKRLPMIKKVSPTTRHIVMKKPIKGGERSLCRDRHFEITEDEDGNIGILASTNEAF
jgi:hypothetical protein